MSLYPARPIPLNDEIFPDYLETVRNAYLGPNWLYYCIQTPVWEKRIREGGGKPVDGRVEFETDDLLEAFYDKWGFEPDEQSVEIHKIHGITGFFEEDRERGKA